MNDIAVLKVSGSGFHSSPITQSGSVKLGDSVFTIGFPNPGLQGVQPKLTDGKVNSLTGMRDDPRCFQISIAVQPGNSGGALVSSAGNVIGIVTARLSDEVALLTSGALPQNVNYAIKSSTFYRCWKRCRNCAENLSSRRRPRSANSRVWSRRRKKPPHWS